MCSVRCYGIRAMPCVRLTSCWSGPSLLMISFPLWNKNYSEHHSYATLPPFYAHGTCSYHLGWLSSAEKTPDVVLLMYSSDSIFPASYYTRNMAHKVFLDGGTPIYPGKTTTSDTAILYLYIRMKLLYINMVIMTVNKNTSQESSLCTTRVKPSEYAPGCLT